MAGDGIQSFAKFHGQMPRTATTGITSWQTALREFATEFENILGCSSVA
jgi:hypothetical protein